MKELLFLILSFHAAVASVSEFVTSSPYDLCDMYPVIQEYKLHPRTIEWTSWDVLLPALQPECHGMWSVAEKVLNYDPAHVQSTDFDAVEVAIKLMSPLPGLTKTQLLLDVRDEDFIRNTLRTKWTDYDPKNSSAKDLKTAAAMPNVNRETLDLFVHKFRYIVPDQTFSYGSKFVQTANAPNVPILLPIAQAGDKRPGEWLENLLASDTGSAVAWRILPALSDFVDICKACTSATEANHAYACLKACPKSEQVPKWRVDSIRQITELSSWYHTPRNDIADMVRAAKDRDVRTALWPLEVSGTVAPMFLAYALGDSSETIAKSYDRTSTWIAESPNLFWKQVATLMYANQAITAICDEAQNAIHLPKLLELEYLTMPFQVHHSIYPWNVNKMLYTIYEYLKSPETETSLSPVDMTMFLDKFEPNSLKTKWLLEVLRNPSSAILDKIAVWKKVIEPPFIEFIPGEYSAYTLHGPMKDICQLSHIVPHEAFAEIHRAVGDHIFWKPIITSTVACWIATRARESSAGDTLDQWNQHVEMLLSGESLELVQATAPKSAPIAPPTSEFKRELARISRQLTPENTETLETLRFPDLKSLWPDTLPRQVSWPKYLELLNHIDNFRAGWGVPNLLYHLREHVKDYISKGQLRDLWKMGFKRVRNIHELDVLLEKVDIEFLDTTVSLPWSSPGWTRLAVMSNTWNADHLVRRRFCEIIADYLVKSAKQESHSQGIAFLLLDSFTRYSAYNARFMRLIEVYLNSLTDPRLESPRTILKDLILDRFLERDLNHDSEGLALQTKLGKLLLIKEAAAAKVNFKEALRVTAGFAANRPSATKNDWDVAFEVANSASFTKIQQQRLGATLLKNMGNEEWKIFLGFFPWDQFRQHIDPLIHLGDLQASRNVLCELQSPAPIVEQEEANPSICVLNTDPLSRSKFEWIDKFSHLQGCQKCFVNFVRHLATHCIPENADIPLLGALEQLISYSNENRSIAAASLLSIQHSLNPDLDLSLNLIKEAIENPDSSKVEKFSPKLDQILPKLEGKDAIDRSRNTLSLIVTQSISKTPRLFEKEQKDKFFEIAKKLVLLMGQEKYVRAVKLLADVSPNSFADAAEKAETITRVFKFAMTDEESKDKAADAESQVLSYDLPKERLAVCNSDTFEQFRARNPNDIQLSSTCLQNRDLVSIPKAVPAIGNELSIELILGEPVLWLGSLSGGQIQLIGQSVNNLCTILESEEHMKQFHFMGVLDQFEPACIQRAKANWIWASIPNQDGISHNGLLEIASQLTASNFEGLDPKFFELANFGEEFWDAATNRETSDEHPCKTISEHVKSKFWEGASVQCLVVPRQNNETLLSLASTQQLSKIDSGKWGDLGVDILSIDPNKIAAMQSARWSYILPVIHNYGMNYPSEYEQFAQKVADCPRDRFIRAFNSQGLEQFEA